ncbi:MAG TPA: alpha/beta hydrolase [Steroidobacteraceae bacterium]|nr:alpha/beta hydrolase [Steroidobacteraceae bacterium]
MTGDTTGRRRRTSGCRALWCGALLGWLALAPPFVTANPMDGAAIITRHDLRIGGNELAYTAETGRIAIRDVATGEPHGYMFYTAYRARPRDGAASVGAGDAAADAARPVMFVWDGGPGAPSAWLHFDIAGPKLLQGTRLQDNPDTWLAATDLVMVDPIGTGFSRPTRAAYESEFYGTLGDVASVTEFVRCWLIQHDDVAAPVFLAGESWGAGRAANVAYALEKRGIHVNGLVLISGGFGLDQRYGSPPLLQALGVVDMASMALYWHRTAPDLGNDPAAVRRAAERWVRQTYAPALARIGKLSTAERDRIAAQLTRFTGIASGAIDRRTLVVTPHQFRTQLLQSQGKVLYLLDGRRTRPPSDAGTPEILHYLREDLGYRTDLPYLGLEELTQGFAPSGTYPKGVGEQWNYATAPMTAEQVTAAIAAAIASGAGPPQLGPPLPGMRQALARNPHLVALVAVGIYDPYQQCARGQATEDALPPDLHRAIEFKCYAGGHAMYLGSAQIRAELSRDVMALVAAAR